MVYQYIERTAIPAWGPQHAQPLIAAGTVAGAMDATFSNTSTLEIFQLTGDKDNESTTGLEAIGKVEANARFQRLAWSTSSSSDSLGVLAGGLENGDITAWNANSILSGDEPLVLHTSAAHTGAVGGLAFNPSAPNLLASGSSNGEVFVWDIVSDFKSYSPGPRSQRLDTVTDLSWNNQVHHILATASSSGALVVWDLRARRDVITLGNVGAIGQQTRPGISATEWNPLSATQLVTASADDTNPVISLWDLRNAQAPSQTLSGGHQRGILSLSWCRKDAGLLLSSGKDNRTVCWNPNDGSIVGELPPSSNWVYDVQWNQANPNLLSAASFDGRVSLYELSRQGPDTPAEDPFAPQSSSPFAPSLSLKKPPKWLARPCGAAFGFGGQLVHFGQGNSLVSITEFVAEPELAAQAQQLEDMLDGNQAAELCKERAGGKDEKSWQVLQILFEEDARDKLVKFLGFDKDQVKTRIQDIVEKEKKEQVKVEEDVKEEEESDNPFESSPADADDFFSKQPQQPSQVDDLQVAFSGAFSLYDKAKDIGAEDADGLITRAILLGDIEAAVTLCIEQERFADALILAPYGSPELAQRVQRQYFAKRAQQAPYVRLLHAIATNDLSDVVANADLAEWDEVLALLCTYAQGDQFSTLCDALGQRLQQVGDSNAVLCYLASGSLDRVAGIWIAEKKDIRSLHVLVEKVAVFRNAVQFVDSGEPPFVLAPLYDCYVEYAEFLAAQGLFAIAAKYLDRVPADYRQAAKDSAAVLRYRLSLTSVAPWTTVQVGPVAPAQPALQQQQQPSQSFVQQQQQQPFAQQQQQPFAQQQQQQPPTQQQAYGGYPQAYPSTMPAVQQYAAQPAQAYPGYSNVGYQQPSGVFQPPPPQPLNPATIPTGLTPPPQRREDVPWNDPPPMLAKPSKRPSQAAAAKPIVSPFPHGRDTPPPPQQQPSAAAVGPPRGGFVPNAGKPLPPPPPPAGQPMQPHQPMQQQQQMQQHQPMQPGFVPQPMQQPGFVPQPMQQPGFVPQPAMPMHQQQQAPPQSMRGQVVSAASAAPPAAAARSPPSAPSPKPTGPKYPAGDRTHLPEVWKPAVGALSAHLARAKQFGAPAQKRMVEDAERRLNALFDLMNCDEVKMKERLVPLFEQLVQAIGARHFPAALNVQAEIMTVNADLTSSVVGVKHLVNVLKTLPM